LLRGDELGTVVSLCLVVTSLHGLPVLQMINCIV